MLLTTRLSTTCLLALYLGLACTPAGAHSGIHERIEHATELIHRQPDVPGLYVDRAFLWGEHGEWKAARKDMRTAERLGHGKNAVAYSHALLLWQQYQEQASPDTLLEALRHSNRAVEHAPSNANTNLLRGRILHAMGDLDKALVDYQAAIDKTRRPHADLYLETARLWLERGRPDKALATLEASVTRLGDATVPVTRMAMDIAEEHDQPGTALAWWSRLPEVLRTLPNELLHKGDLLTQTGKTDAAQEAYCEASRQLAKRPAWRRQKPNIQGVDRQLKKRIHGSCH